MTELPGRADPPSVARDDRLDSWKQIAAYLGRGVTTVQRWEQEGLPVRRLPHAKKGSVFAFKREIDAWMTSRELEAGSNAEAAPALVVGEPRQQPSHLHSVAILVAGAVAGLIVFSWVASQRAGSVSPSTTHLGNVVPRPVANDEAVEAYPTLSPDGDRLAYVWRRAGADGLYIKAISGGSPRPLFPGDAKTYSRAWVPKWSPRGDLIAFLAQHEGENPDFRTLYVVSVAGGAPTRLTSIWGLGLCWTPDGRTLAFSDRTATGEPFSIFAMDLSSGERRRLTAPPAGAFGDTRCAFSPDGSRLAVSRFITRYQSDVYLVPLSPSDNGVQRITHDVDGINGLDWSPDGESVVYGTHNGLWRVPALATRTANPSLIVAAAVRDLGFSRPPNGHPARLVYHHSADDVNIWRWDATAMAQARIRRVAGSTTYDDHPSVSPDGRRVAFASNRTGANEIWVAQIDGSGVRQLTFYQGPLVIAPRWSPDGTRLVFAARSAGNWDIHAVHADGSRATRLTWEATQDDNPSWSRDGRWIYFRSDRDGVARIWKMPSDGGAASAVTSGPGSQAFESPDGETLYFVRSADVPGLWSLPTTGGAETFVTPHIRESYWGVADRGIAFLVADPRLSPGGASVQFFDFGSRAVQVLVKIPRAADHIHPGFAVSADARSIMWVQSDTQQSDVMLIDPWPR